RLLRHYAAAASGGRRVDEVVEPPAVEAAQSAGGRRLLAGRFRAREGEGLRDGPLGTHPPVAAAAPRPGRIGRRRRATSRRGFLPPTEGPRAPPMSYNCEAWVKSRSSASPWTWAAT